MWGDCFAADAFVMLSLILLFMFIAHLHLHVYTALQHMLARYIVLSARLVWKVTFRLELNNIWCGRKTRVSKCSFYAFSTFSASPLRLYASFLSTLLFSPVYFWVPRQAYPVWSRCHQCPSTGPPTGSAQTVRRKARKNV
jgi:hypothetical protein